MPEFSNSEEFLRKRLKILRKKANLTQNVVAELAEISYDYYKDIEQGVRPNASIRIIEQLAQVYGLSIYELFSPQVPEIKLKQKPIPSPHYQKRKGIVALKKELKQDIYDDSDHFTKAGKRR